MHMRRASHGSAPRLNCDVSRHGQHIMMRKLPVVFFLLGFGLLPFWGSVAYVYRGSLSSSAPADYWAVAPWIVVVASVYCSITLLMSVVTCVVYYRTRGTRVRQLAWALGVFSTMSFVVVSVGLGYWNQYQEREANNESEKAAAVVYAEQSAELASALPGPRRVGFARPTHGRDRKAIRYEVYAYPENDRAAAVHMIIDVSRSNGTPVFNVACILSRAEYRSRQAGTHPCQAPSDN